jgi:hypothetical protein
MVVKVLEHTLAGGGGGGGSMQGVPLQVALSGTAGGDGVLYNLSGVSTYYAGGGGGGSLDRLLVQQQAEVLVGWWGQSEYGNAMQLLLRQIRRWRRWSVVSLAAVLLLTMVAQAALALSS